MAGICNKSYKSIVMEACAKQQIIPAFETVMINLQPSEFKCKLRIPPCKDWKDKELKSEGRAATKKDSEHAAAKAMLPQILSDFDLIKLRLKDAPPPSSNNSDSDAGLQTEPSANDKTKFDKNLVSDTDADELEQFQGIPITDLITLCRFNTLDSPVFSESHEPGPYNTHIFTVTCSVGETSSKSARRLRKQDAKTMAAFRVYRDLEQKGFPMETKRSKKANRALPETKLVHSRFVKPKDEADGQAEPEEEKSEEEKKIEFNAESYGGILNYLMETAKGINITLNFTQACKLKDTNYLTFVTLIFERNFDYIYTNHLTFDGVGSTVEESRDRAAMGALKMLAELEFIKL